MFLLVELQYSGSIGGWSPLVSVRMALLMAGVRSLLLSDQLLTGRKQ